MSVQFVFGASGTGKTKYLYDKMIKDSMVENHKPILFLLPEQSNMAAEQEMIWTHPKGGTMDISVVSFTRLAFKVFDERNIHTRDILDDYGKSMLIMKVLKENEKDLEYYKKMIGRQGFVDEIKSILSEFYQYQITEEVLEKAIERVNPEKSLFYKLKDLKLLLHTFDEAMANSYMVTEQVLSMLKEVISESEYLKDAEIYFDGFTGFTPIQFGVIEELMKNQNSLTFSFIIDEDIFGRNDYKENELFSLSKQTIDRLCKLAQDNQITILPHIGMTKNYRFKATEDLLYLERNLFRFPIKPYTKDVKDLSIVSAVDFKEETKFIAQQIKKYVMEQGYHYHDFAIITGDFSAQSAIWKDTMEELEIPYFLDYSERLYHNPIVEIVGMILEIFRSDFSYESVFSFLKTGFLNLDKNAIYDLENYALKYGVKGYHWWKDAFRGGVKGLHEINETRQSFMDQLEEIIPVFLKKEAKAKEYLKALYQFISTNQMAERLHEKSLWLEENKDLREAKAYGQVYEKFISVLDKTMDILGDEVIKRDTFVDVILSGMEDMKLGIIPSTLDQVVIGDIERTRLQHIRILFIAGMNEGIIPKNISGNGILVDKDRETLKNLEINLAPDSKESIFLQQFYFYTQVTQSSEQVILTYSKTDDRGGELRPSYFLNRIKSIFPNLLVQKAEEKVEGRLPVTERELISYFANALAQEQEEDSSLYRVMYSEKEELTTKILEGYCYDNCAGILDQAIARKLYGQSMVHSVSRLETYVSCAYQFFLKFGLNLKKRDEYRVETSNIGTILHAVMEVFFTQVKEGSIDLKTISDGERNQLVEELTIKAAKEENETIFESSYRNKHQLDVLIRIAKRSIKNLCRHLEIGGMKPTYFEKEFSPKDELSYINMALQDDIKMELKGIVDRVDIRETEDAIYLKVIDYKSGAKDLDYVKMYEGKQLQLTVYMSVMMELLQRQYPNKKIIPTGMYYYHIYDPIIEELEEQKQEEKRIESSRLTGFVNQDEESLELMDQKTGLVTPVKYKKDGSFDSRNSALVTTEDLMQISKFVRSKMEEIGHHIIDGDIEMNPEKGEMSSPCNYCDYRSICQFDPGYGGNAYRIASNIKKENAKQIILGKEEGDAE